MELIKGFEVAFQLPNLFACFIGVLVGTLVGVLPGIGPAAAIAILFPFTFKYYEIEVCKRDHSSLHSDN